MSLLIAIVLLLTLFWGETISPAESVDWIAITFKVALLTAISPAFAALQICVARRRHANGSSQDWFRRFRTMAVAHTIVWSIISISISVWIRWSDAVQLIPMTETIPLADDLLLAAPALIGLVSSWAIFLFGAPQDSLATDKSRTSIFALWLRMQVVMIAAPILFAFFATDCLNLALTVQLSSTGQIVLWCIAGLAVAASILLYPQMMLLVWSTKRIEDAKQRNRIESLFHLAGLRPRKVRVWKTGDSIVNAAAVGIVPGTEIVIISDLLLNKFDNDEVDAILLHEIGHIRHLHTIRRIAMVLVPLIILAIDQWLGIGLHAMIERSALLSNAFGSAAQFLPAFGFLIYLLIVSKTVFRSMEFEADQFAIETLSETGASDSVESALQKMAVIYPAQANRRRGLHPSIRQRLASAIQFRAEISGEANQEQPSAGPSPKSISLDPIAVK
jgi:Zn-dependent protease with chaperone function